MEKTTRRNFVKKTAMAGMLPFVFPYESTWNGVPKKNDLDINIFSKHLQFLEFEAVGAKAAEIGFSGVDLTVRPKGHVLPETVEKVLPKAIEDIKRGGSLCKMMTTAVGNSQDTLDKSVLKTASEQGIKYYRSNWFRYEENQPMQDTLDQYKDQIAALSLLNKQLGLVGCYQNHSGLLIGASVWELMKLIESADNNYFGLQYDIRHATVEGGLSWKNGLRLVHNNIKTIVLKDFRWEIVNGKWKTVDTPIGEGMVDFKTYFGLLKKYEINVPVSLHFEYPLGGAEHGKSTITVNESVVFDAMRRDLKKVRELWDEA
ncbi:TIM barrel protein [Reichenbachiella sp. MALMAid0571]|uniref:sugar phosphate isomerase/epimerase family protein n=1 Tax=Reichenbachiella sp. MALMAid0571 TaxID=3143939 RepID=UPI0032DEA139